jgi:hypothetical protein
MKDGDIFKRFWDILPDERVGTAEKNYDTVHSQSDLVQQGYTQTHLGLGTPK